MAGKPILTPEQRAENRKQQVEAWRQKNPFYNKTYYIKNKDTTKETLQKNYRKVKEEKPWVLNCRSAKSRAKAKGLEFNLDNDYLHSIWTDTCPIFNIKMVCAKYELGSTRNHKSKPLDNSPTLDRIDSSLGYVKGNVLFISYRANVIKNCGTAQEHRLIAEFIERSVSHNILS